MPTRSDAVSLALLLALSACAAHRPPGDAPGAVVGTSERDAAAGVEDLRLKTLLIRHWEELLRRNPIFATQLGDHRRDAEIPDRSLAAREQDRATARAWLAEAQAIAASKSLRHQDTVTTRLFIESLETDIASEVCVFEEWTVAPRDNPLITWSELASLHPVRTPLDAQNLIARYRKAPRAVDVDIENLRRGASRGLLGNANSMRRVVTMLERQLAEPLDRWPMLEPLASLQEGWSEAERGRLHTELAASIRDGLKPALERYLELVKTELLPRARGDDRPGLGALPNGAACYLAQSRAYTTLDTSAAELHRRGLDEIERIDHEMEALGRKLFNTPDFARTLERLRSDPALYFKDAAEVEAKARSALAAARAKIPAYFGTLPKADCVVTRIPDIEAPFTSIAYYRQPVPDGSRPGEYFINVHEPTTRPRYEAEALAYHEAIPGHHLQIAISQELPALPAFRKHLGMTVFVEGWALYTEQLADEMKLYSSDLDRMGMLSYEAWRAARLVVDTGLHAMGWSRETAKRYMLEHTALAANNIDNEVDRYIAWPGQALAYKTGQLELWRLRHLAEKELGSGFDLKAFHDLVLKNGAVSLPVLTAEVEAWVRTRRSAG